MTSKRRSRVLAVLAAGSAVGVAVGSATAVARGLRPTPGPAAALANAKTPDTARPRDAADLAAAVQRWNAEHPSTGPGSPGAPVDLLAGVGRGRDTGTGFATDRGGACYEVLAAGSCGRLDNASGVTFSILYTRDDGTRLYGVAADQVRRVQVQVDGVLGDAVLRKNGFYYQLPEGATSDDVEYVFATWHDGSTRPVRVHP